MKRRVMLVLVGTSLLVCLAAIAFWASDATFKTQGVRSLGWNWGILIHCSRDGISVRLYHSDYHVVGPMLGRDEPSRKVANIWMKRFGEYDEIVLVGFAVGYGPIQSSDLAGHITMEGRTWALGLRLWFIIVLSSLLPVIVLLRYLKRRRQIPPGCCRRCGYDLRATPERRPECGAVQVGVLPR